MASGSRLGLGYFSPDQYSHYGLGWVFVNTPSTIWRHNTLNIDGIIHFTYQLGFMHHTPHHALWLDRPPAVLVPTNPLLERLIAHPLVSQKDLQELD